MGGLFVSARRNNRGMALAIDFRWPFQKTCEPLWGEKCGDESIPAIRIYLIYTSGRGSRPKGQDLSGRVRHF